MKAVMKLAEGADNVALRDVAEPNPGPGEAILEVAAAGICGTDLHILHGEFATRPPVVMGHELAGRVAALGPGAEGPPEGTRVTTETYFETCGRCASCRDGRPNLCLARLSIGSKVDGGFARYVKVPARNLHALPEGVDETAGALTEPLACVVHGVLDPPTVQPGDVAVLAGPGAIGLLTLQVLRAAGATTVVLGTAADAERLALARDLGADATVDVEAEDPAARLAEVAPGGSADVVYECSGAGPAAATLLGLARRGGRYVQIGLFGAPVAWDLDQVCYRELTVTGSNATTPASWRRALRLLAGGAVDTAALVTHRFALEDWPEAFDVFERKEGVKLLFVPG